LVAVQDLHGDIFFRMIQCEYAGVQRMKEPLMSSRGISIAILVAAIHLVGCVGDDGGSTGDDDGGPLGGSLTVSGEVVDFQTGTTIDSAASVTTSGLSPAPAVSTTGANFTITAIPENSAFQILAGAPPTHRSTFSASVVVIDADLTGIKAQAVSESYLATLSTAFGVTPTAAKGVLFVKLVNNAGLPQADVPGSQLLVGGGAIGPKFLDTDLTPQPNATKSSASGYAVFFEVPTGVVSLGVAAAPTVTLEMATSPINPGVITIAEAKVTQGAPTLPTNLSFSQDIVPIFAARGCVACHTGGGVGKDLGGLKLDGGDAAVYRELVEEKPNLRVNPAAPESSWVLQLPSREDPPDRHPNVTFASPQDPDYVKLLVWISEGALQN
jgi:hypothetical protein